MNCNQAKTLLAAYVDGEVDALRNYSMKKHLQDCAGCAVRHGSMLALRTRILTEVPYFEAPPALRERVLATVRAVHTPIPLQSRPMGDRWRWLSGGVLAGCTATVLAWALGSTVVAWRAHEDFAVLAVATHVHATLDDHLTEVASSDRHTVKPWLSARLDYSPPVQDLANEGFPLVGGRLEYFERHAVATLVYRYRKHTIDVFVRPETSHLPTPTLRTVRGFNVAHATGPTMDWVAVSDAEPAVLSAFVQRLAREDIPR